MTHPLVKMIPMSTTQLHLIDGGADRPRGGSASGSTEESTWRLDAETIAHGRQGIARARAVLATRRRLDEVPAA